MKLTSWNVNGLRAVLKKNFTEFVASHAPDILCLQETKARPEQVELPLELAGYRNYWNSAEKPGYSGTAVFTKHEPLDVRLGIGSEQSAEGDREGRVLTLEFPDHFLVTVYTPNAGRGLPAPAKDVRIDPRRVMVVDANQVEAERRESVRVLLDGKAALGDSQFGRLHILDGLKPAMRTLTIAKDPDCKACSTGAD